MATLPLELRNRAIRNGFGFAENAYIPVPGKVVQGAVNDIRGVIQG